MTVSHNKINMEIWNSYVGLFTHENPAVITGVIIATIAVLTFLFNFVLKPFFSWLSKLFKKIYDAYSFSYIPAVGKAITGDRDSYQYLAESIRKFPKQEDFKQMMLDAGFFKARYHNLFNGICAIHIGTKV